jgi:hypothetical protein
MRAIHLVGRKHGSPSGIRRRGGYRNKGRRDLPASRIVRPSAGGHELVEGPPERFLFVPFPALKVTILDRKGVER